MSTITAKNDAASSFDEDDLDFDLDALDDLDEAELQKLLEEAEAEEAEAANASASVPPIEKAQVTSIEFVAPKATSQQPEDLDLTGLTLTPVPRINIHAFCETPAITELVGSAAADRRLAKAHVTIQNGDAFKAAQVFAHESTPNLLILEAGRSATELLEGLGVLAEVCDPSTQVLIVGTLNDIGLYRSLIDQGIADYLVSPRSPLQVISAISSLYSDPSAPPVGKTFVFMGARGGVGSSTICHNVAWAIAEQCRSDTVMLDLDLAFGTGSLDFEQDPSQGLSEALGAPERLDDVLLDRLLQKCTDRLSLFSAPNLLDRDYDLPSGSFEQVIDIVRAGAPSVVIDMPHIWSDWARHQIQAADEIVVTATPDLAAFRNAKNIFETIAPNRSNDSAPMLIINQTGVKGRPEVSPEQFEEAIGVKPTAVIPFDPVAFGTAATNAQVLFEVAPKSKTSATLTELAQRLTGKVASKADGKGLSLKSLLSLKG